MPISLGDKSAIITNAAEDVGLALARAFLQAGARVMLADADEKALAAAEVELDAEEGKLAHFHYVAQDKLSIANLIAATIDRYDRIDILVNGAPASMAPGDFLELGIDQFDGALGANVRAVFKLSQAVGKKMIQQTAEEGRSAGVIVNLSSIAASRTVPELLTLSVSCAALDQLTRSMAASLAPLGIRVNAVAMGGVLTARLRTAFRTDEKLRDDMIAVTPLGRLAELDEVADTVTFLASDHAGYITGQVVAVDGGRLLLDPLASPIR